MKLCDNNERCIFSVCLLLRHTFLFWKGKHLMKKLVSLLSLSILVLSAVQAFYACAAPRSQDTSEHQHLWKDATCTKPQTCLTCGATQGEALGHTTDSEVCLRCGKDFRTWNLHNYVDEFRNPTDEEYISTVVYGTFSNSATTDSDLKVRVLVDKDSIAFRLYEYSRIEVKCSYGRDNYTITMMDSDNQKYNITGTMYSGGDRVCVDKEYKSLVLGALRKRGTVRFYIVSAEYSTTEYLFSVNTSNFSSLYKTLK